MATLRRILKYTPAVVLGLLVVVWVASCVTYAGVDFPARISIGWVVGNFIVSREVTRDTSTPSSYFGISEIPGLRAGSFSYAYDEFGTLMLMLPIFWLITIALPLAIGPFLSFRFRLWHYFAYTALIALELAYYLRLQ